MKLKKKRKKYKLRTISTDEILAAMARRQIEVIYSWGAFCLHGLGCKVGDIAFRFDFDVNPLYSLGRYLQTHTEGEIAEKIVKEINGRGRLRAKERKYCIMFLSQAQQNKKAGC